MSSADVIGQVSSQVTCLSKTRTGVERSVIGQVSSYMSKTRTGVDRCHWMGIK